MVTPEYFPEIDGVKVPFELSTRSNLQVIASVSPNLSKENALYLGACLSEWYQKQTGLNQALFDRFVFENDDSIQDLKASFDKYFTDNAASCGKAEIFFDITPQRIVNRFLDDLSVDRDPGDSVLVDFTKDTFVKVGTKVSEKWNNLLLAAVKKWIMNIRVASFVGDEKPNLTKVFEYAAANDSKANLSMLSYALLDSSSIKKLGFVEAQARYQLLGKVAQTLGNRCIGAGKATVQAINCNETLVGEHFFWLDVQSTSGTFTFGLEK